MTIQSIIRRFKKYKPKTKAETQRVLGIRLRGEGAGAFRYTYRIGALPLVIKFPLESEGPDGRDCIGHSNAEVRKIKRLGACKALRRHLPKVYYHDAKAGIVVMTWCDKLKGTAYMSRDQREVESLYWIIEKLVREHTGISVSDLEGNTRMDKKGNLQFVDLGL